jgi:hypothetical protein
MTAPDQARLHSRVTQHLSDIDHLRGAVAATLAEISGEQVVDWNAGQLAAAWEALADLPLARRILRTLTQSGGEWTPFRSMVTEDEGVQARNELGAMRRILRKLRSDEVPLFERAQRGEGYLQSYRMHPDVAALLRTVIEETDA